MIKKYKRLNIFWLILTVLCWSLTGCQGTTNAIESAAEPVAEPELLGTFKVAVILPGLSGWAGWNQGGRDGGQLIEKELGATVAIVEGVSADDAEQTFRQYAEEGCDLIIGHSGEFIDALEKIAVEFPRTKFAVVTRYAGNNRNLGALSFYDAETGYLAGVLAAMKTESNKIAYIGGVESDELHEQADAFAKGALSINPDSDVSYEWVGSWWNPGRAKAIAEALIANGVDVFVVNTGGSDPDLFEAAKSGGAQVIAWGVDYHEEAPDVIITSIIQHPSMLFLNGARLAMQGHWEGKQYKFGLLDEAQEIAPFYGMLTAEEEARFDSILDGVQQGQIDVTP